MSRWLNRIVTPPLMFCAALILFAEEVLWEAFKRIMAALGRLPLVRTLEAWITRLPPHGAAVVFLLPGALLLPVKFAALWLFAHGHAIAGLQLLIAAKLVGTALVARIFTLTRASLLTIGWLARLYETIMRWRARLYGFVKASRAWAMLENWRARIRDWFTRRKPGRMALRLRAIRRRWRRQGATPK